MKIQINCPGQPPKKYLPEDRALLWFVGQCPFSSSTILRDNWIPNRATPMKTIRNHLKTAGSWARTPIKCPLQTPAHKAARLESLNALWRNIHWSDESCFLLHMNAASNIKETIPFGSGPVMVWRCISHDCKLDLVTVQGNLNGLRGTS